MLVHQFQSVKLDRVIGLDKVWIYGSFVNNVMGRNMRGKNAETKAFLLFDTRDISEKYSTHI